jgi:hypothetical protein
MAYQIILSGISPEKQSLLFGSFDCNTHLIEEKFGREVDLIIDGGMGGIEPSTIVNCTEGEAEIIRQGKGWLEE